VRQGPYLFLLATCRLIKQQRRDCICAASRCRGFVLERHVVQGWHAVSMYGLVCVASSTTSQYLRCVVVAGWVGAQVCVCCALGWYYDKLL
jgi:hypothetical protein